MNFELIFKDSQNIVAHQTDKNLTFTFDPDPHILELSPAHVTLRADSLNIKVKAKGLNFRNTSLTIKVGHLKRKMTFVSPSEAIFVPPNLLEPGSYRVSVSNNDVDFALASSNVTLTYNRDFIVRHTSFTRVQISDTD